MRYLSLFSGIEAATVAWEPLGWEAVAFCEVDEFPSAVLAHRWPDVPNLGDITKVDWSDFNERYGAVDVIVGGSPCQSFSVAGGRESLDGQSRLMFEYLRAVEEVRPRIVVWENVPGVLNTKDNAFGQLLWTLGELGYRDLAYRVLDAQFFGVAQRRRRVFVVGHLGEGFRSAAVLFEPDGLRWDHPSSREKRESLTRAAQQRSEKGRCGSVAYGMAYKAGAKAQAYPISKELHPTLSANRHDASVLCVQESVSDIAVCDNFAPPVKACQAGSPQIVCMADDNANAAIDFDMCGSLKVGGSAPAVADGYTVRRLTPRECERLQGFPTTVELEVGKMTPGELIACALANGDVVCDFDAGKVYGTRGPGGIKLNEPRELGFLHPSGYVHVSLHAGGEKKQVRAHRIIYQAAYGEIPDGFVIDHINGNKADNRLHNLQMMTPEGNSRKAKLDGAYLSGDDSPTTKIFAEVRTKIRHEYAQGNTSYQKLAEKYGVTKSHIGVIIRETDHTLIPYKGKTAGECPDTPRYKALGNSMAVPVMAWIGRRLEAVDA